MRYSRSAVADVLYALHRAAKVSRALWRIMLEPAPVVRRGGILRLLMQAPIVALVLACCEEPAVSFYFLWCAKVPLSAS